MISTLPSKSGSGLVLWLAALLLLPVSAWAQGSVVLSVSPTLFDMTAGPTQEWSSTIRVINANEFPLQIYTDIVNFEPTGESGQGSLVPVMTDQVDGATLAQWITIDQEAVLIPAEQTVSIPFTITVPEEAPPGGHFAAILIGTRSFGDSPGAAQVETSQVVTSLVFLRVAGDIVEAGQIRDFTTSRLITESPEMDFSIRFENTGNVHLQPQGNITITNMWGKERGVLPINQNSQFGNVLPESIRQYTFSWAGDWSFADIGKYSAELTLGYGDQRTQFANSAATFWVIPWRALLLVLVIVGGLIWCIIWGVKVYIRRMLQLAGVTPELRRDQRPATSRSAVSITAPLEEGILDLRSGLRQGTGSLATRLLTLASAYKLFLLIAGALVVFVALFTWYLVLALTGERGYEASYEQNGEMVPLVVPDTQSEAAPSEPIVVNTLPEIKLINRSGVPEADNQLATRLIQRGYDVVFTDSTEPLIEARTVIVYDPSLADQVLRLQNDVPNALLSAFVAENPDDPMITIYVGTDQVQP